jgi:predicted nucleic acid-binding protein
MPEQTRAVVCNTSPLQYLHQTGLLPLLPALYGRILVPPAVATEIDAGRARGVDLPVLSRLPWLSVQPVRAPAILPAVTDLGAGEREVLAMVTEIDGALAILDDGLARRYAGILGVKFTGTVGILVRAKRDGLLPAVRPVLDQLAVLRFRLDPSTRAGILRLVGEKD